MSTSKHLKPEEVEYIAFEGGGGKGNAYLGAIKGLQELGILPLSESKNLKGVSGASAGAIMALMVALGYTYQEILSITKKFSFNDFFDIETVVTPEIKFLQKVQKLKEDLIPDHFDFLLNHLVHHLLKNENKVLAGKIINNKVAIFHNLKTHFGIFPGLIIYNYFKKIIEIKKVSPNITFKEYNKELQFTAVNLDREKVYILSKETTPDLPIALGARMSMSLPIVFWPVNITARESKLYGIDEGLWVDGGLFNNTPVQGFYSDNVLLFRLGRHQIDNQIDSLFKFLKVWLINVGAKGSGSGQLNENTYKNYYKNLISLDIDGTSLLKFDLDDTALANLIKKNCDITTHYFAHYLPAEVPNDFA